MSPATWKKRLRSTWLFPRYIGQMYSRRVFLQNLQHAQGTLLDLGCGQRQYEDLLGPRVDRYIGLDWPAAATLASPDIVADARHLPIADGSIDTVLATEILEHVPDPDEFVEQIAQALRVGGSLILTVPFLEPIHEEPRDYYRFTRYGLQALLERHRFTVDQIQSKGGWWSLLMGSLLSKSLYDLANPLAVGSHRRGHWGSVVALPLCAAGQVTGYLLDQWVGVPETPHYTMGYVVLATRTS